MYTIVRVTGKLGFIQGGMGGPLILILICHWMKINHGQPISHVLILCHSRV
jgi:hypothetical protein